jgi:hypothetical protein
LGGPFEESYVDGAMSNAKCSTAEKRLLSFSSHLAGDKFCRESHCKRCYLG